MPELLGAPYAATLVSGADLTGSTVTCTVTAPDGSTASASPTVSGSTATVTIVPAQVGTYLLVWAISGLVSGGQTDQFTVEAPTLDLVSLSEVRSELNINLSDTSKDVKLREWMRAATGVVENVTGAILPKTRTDIFPGRCRTIVLPERWVAAVTSVQEANGASTVVLTEQTFGTAGNGYSYTWDRVTNALSRVSGYGPSMFGPLVSVTYTAGLTTIPADIRVAAAELIKHWNAKAQPVRSGGPTPYGSAAGDDGVMVGNYMVPNAVMELLEPYRRPPGVA